MSLTVYENEWQDRESKNPEPGGLVNEGNTCYRNVLLTLLLHTPRLVNLCQTAAGIFCPPSHDHYLECLLCHFNRLVTAFWAREQEFDKLMDLVRSFWEKTIAEDWEDDIGAGWRELDEDRNQRDAAEYMEEVFEKLGVCLAPISETFGSKQQQVVICGTCHSTSNRLDFERKYLTGSLREASGSRCGIREVLSTSFTAHDRLTHCTHCNTEMWQKYCEPVLTASETLLVLFQYPPGPPKVRLQLDSCITLSTYPGSPSDTENVVYAFYRLYGILFQSGADNAGHYMAGMETPAGKWMWYNNDWSERTSLKQLEERQDGDVKIYMLAYRKLFQMPGEQPRNNIVASSDPPMQQQPGESIANPQPIVDDVSLSEWIDPMMLPEEIPSQQSDATGTGGTKRKIDQVENADGALPGPAKKTRSTSQLRGGRGQGRGRGRGRARGN